jgi:transposase
MLRLMPIEPVPPETARVAQAAFPKGNRYLRLADELETLFTADAFLALFPAHGQPALPPWRLALATILQFAEGLADRQAAHAVRRRIDWKYVLRLELTEPGFDASVLSEFGTRLVVGAAESLLFDTLLTWCRERQLVKARGRQRTDSTHILAAVRALNRLEVVGETMRHALNTLAVVAPEWICWGPHALTITGKLGQGLALMPNTSRLIGISSTRPVRPARRVSAGRRRSIIAGMPSSR